MAGDDHERSLRDEIERRLLKLRGKLPHRHAGACRARRWRRRGGRPRLTRAQGRGLLAPWRVPYHAPRTIPSHHNMIIEYVCEIHYQGIARVVSDEATRL
jgi:hypothetical protein